MNSGGSPDTLSSTMQESVSPYVHPDWPRAVWDVSGAFADDRELVSFFDYCKEVLGFEPFHIVHGAPLCEWNSGRVMRHFTRSTEDVREAGLAYAGRGIAIYLTFTNLFLEESHLKESFGNALCKFFEHHNPTGRNAVIVANDLLRDYIRREYPGLRLVSSILKITQEFGRGRLDVYRRLGEEYDEVMVHPDDVLHPEFLAQLENKEKYILLINEYCIRHCPIRHLHYRDLSEASLHFLSHDARPFEERQSKNGCQDLLRMLTNERYGVLALNVPEMKALYDLGFRHFKIQGRGHTNAMPLLADMLRLILKPDADDENAMHATSVRFWESLMPDTTP